MANKSIVQQGMYQSPYPPERLRLEVVDIVSDRFVQSRTIEKDRLAPFSALQSLIVQCVMFGIA